MGREPVTPRRTGGDASPVRTSQPRTCEIATALQWPRTSHLRTCEIAGRSSYCMTGPEGDRSCGYCELVAVDSLRSFEVRDGFSNPDGTPKQVLLVGTIAG